MTLKTPVLPLAAGSHPLGLIMKTYPLKTVISFQLKSFNLMNACSTK